MAEATIAAAMVKAKADADDWFKKMVAAANAAKTSNINSYDLESNWMRIRRDSQKLLYLRDDHLSIVEELNKVQNTFDEYNSKSEHLKMSIALLQEAVNLAKKGKARCSKHFEIKLRKKQIELESINTEITMSNNFLLVSGIASSAQMELESKKASLEEKIRCYPEKEAKELSSFDSKIRASEEQVREKAAKLETVEPNVVVAGEILKTMKDALRCCEEAIPMANAMFVQRVRQLRADHKFVRVVEAADVGIMRRVYVMRDRFKGFLLNFAVPRADFCEEISNIYRGITDLKHDKLYQLSFDEGGVFHIRQLTTEEATALGFKHIPAPYFFGGAPCGVFPPRP